MWRTVLSIHIYALSGTIASRCHCERREAISFRFRDCCGFGPRGDNFFGSGTEHPAHAHKVVLMFGFILAIVGVLHAQQDSTTVDSLLLQQIQEQMATANEAEPSQAVSRGTISTNPNMSVIGDFRLSFNRPDHRNFDAEMHETELALQSVVDPYARADFYLSISRDEATGKYGVGLEEVTLTSTDLPVGLQLKVGKLRSTFGKINNVHPHALAFIEAPLVYRNFLSEEGLNDEGLSLSWLVPNPLDFFQELTFEVTRGMVETKSFAASTADRFLYHGHLKNFWDLTDDATLEFGLSAVTGPNDAGYSSMLGGVDITYKWKPLQYNTYQSLVVQSEVLTSNKKTSSDESIHSWGGYLLTTWQVGPRYFLTGRLDYSNSLEYASLIYRAVSLTLGWYATEFQKIELEARHSTSNGFADANQVVFRSIFVIGAHGAHAY